MTDFADRRRVLTGIAGAGLAALLPPPAFAQATTLTSLRSTAKSWLWAAEDFATGNGDFERAGLRVSSSATGRGVNTDALLSGATDVLLGATTQTMRVQIPGRPVKMIAGMVNKYASHIVVKRQHLERAGVTENAPTEARAAALKGLKLGTTGAGAAPDALLRYVLGLARLDPDREVQLVPIQGGGPAMLAAFERGAIDGFSLSSPTSDLAVTKFGGAYLFRMTKNPPPALADYLYIGVSVTEKTLAEKRPQVVAYVKALAAALKAIDQQPVAFKTWAKGFFADMDADLFEQSFATDGGIYLKSPLVTERHFDLNVEFLNTELKLLGQPAVPATFKYADAYDMSVVREALG